MYKKRFTKWDLRKNHTDPEMRAVAVKTRKRKLQNRDTISYVRGKEVTQGAVERYFRRRRIDLNDVIAESDGVPTPPTVQCATPPYASPTLSTPTVPFMMAVPEQALHSIGVYITGSFDPNVNGQSTWLSTSETEFACSSQATDKATRAALTAHMDTLHNQALVACFLFSENRGLEAVQNLSSAMAGIKEITRFQYPPLLDRLPRTLLAVTLDKQRSEIAYMILNQFAEMADIQHGSAHPLAEFCRLLASMDSRSLIEAIYVATRTIRDGFQKALGPFHRTTLAAQYTYVRTVLAAQGREAIGYRKVVSDCEVRLAAGDLRIVKARSDLAMFLLRTKQYVGGKLEAETIISETKNEAWSLEWRNVRTILLCARGYSCLAGCEYGLGRVEEAIVQKRIAIELYKSLDGEQNAHVHEEMFWLAEWLFEVGKMEEGTKVLVDREEYAH